MNKHLQLPLKIETVQYPGQTVLLLLFHREALCDWCAGLSLLKEGLIEILTVSEQLPRKKDPKVQFLKDKDPKVKGNRVSFRSDRSEVVLSGNSVDYLQYFFLKYYRDGVAEVDHLDLEGVNAETGRKDIYVTFQVPEFMPPVTPEEARRRLDD